eukprot:g12734.t1
MEVYDATMIRQDTMLAERPKTSLSIWRSLALVFGGLIVGAVSHRWSVAHRYRDNAYSSSPLENSELDLNHKMNTLQVARDGSKSKSKRSKECSPYLGGPNAGVFTCNNGWEIYLPWKNNGRCECPDCEDETNWTCQTCGGCIHLEVHRCVGLRPARAGSLMASIAARTLTKLRWTWLHVATSLFWVQGLSFFPSVTVTS